MNKGRRMRWLVIELVMHTHLFVVKLCLLWLWLCLRLWLRLWFWVFGLNVICFDVICVGV